jgi:5-formyltetrahydrofolate cyclo-ligase
VKTKSKIRQQIRERLTGLSANQVDEYSGRIIKRLTELIDWSRISSAHIYLNKPNLTEADTGKIINYLQNEYPKLTLYAPIGKDETKQYELKGKVKQLVKPPMDITLFIIPLVAFDIHGFRVGQGGGYYDRHLKDYPNAQKIGLAFELQKVDEIPAENHDVKLDSVITERQVYNFSGVK